MGKRAEGSLKVALAKNQKSRSSVGGSKSAGSKRGLQTANKYYRRARIPRSQFLLILRYFAQDISATRAAKLTGVSRKSVTSIFLKLRWRMAQECDLNSPLSSPEARQAKKFSCICCVCGKCRTSSRKSAVFGILVDQDSVFTAVMPDCQKPILRALIRRRLAPKRIRLNGWHGYHALIDAEYRIPFSVTGHTSKQSDEENRAQRIEDFWGYILRRLEKFNGVPHRTFHLHLKESEWRFNLANRSIYAELLRLIEERPL